MKRFTVIIEYQNGRKNKLVKWAEDADKAKTLAMRDWGNPVMYRKVYTVEGY